MLETELRISCVCSCSRSVEPDVCVCKFNLRETPFSIYHLTGWSVFHDPLCGSKGADVFFFFVLKKRCGSNQVFFECSKQQQQQEAEFVPTCLGMPWAVIHLLTETTLLVANPEACRQAPPQARRDLPGRRGHCRILHGTCAQPAVGTHSSGWPGASVPADTADWKSSARPQNRDSAMRCLGWIGQDFVKYFGSVTTSQNTSLCGTCRWHFGSVESGGIQHQRTQITSSRTGTKKLRAYA